MHFQIHTPPLQGGLKKFDWSLEKKDGIVCRSGSTFETEREARSDIAQAKKSFRATSRSKVFSPGEAPE